MYDEMLYNIYLNREIDYLHFKTKIILGDWYIS